MVETPLTMPQNPFYSSRPWKEARGKYLAQHPYCKVCERIFIKTRATEVDHIIPIEAGGAPLDPKNFSGQCKRHHSQKTMVLDRPTVQTSRRSLVTTGADGFPCHVEESKYGKS